MMDKGHGKCPCRWKNCRRHGDCNACRAHHDQSAQRPLPACEEGQRKKGIQTVFRKATKEDVERISEIYEEIHTENEAGRMTTGWIRGVYPSRETAEASVGCGDMFVEEEDGRIVAAARINQEQVAEYADADWQYDVPDGQVMVLHVLVVSPGERGRGYGTRFVEYYEAYAREHGCTCLRMDTNERNRSARALYQKLGYREVSIVPCVFNGIPDVQLVCLEKKL